MANRKKLKFASYVVMPIVIFYCSFTAYLYFFQEQYFFHPTEKIPQALHGFKTISLKTDDGLILKAAYHEPSNNTQPVIVFFHGNAGDFQDRYHKVTPLTEQGYGVMLTEYRGFGGNPGEASEQGFYTDGRAYMKYVQDVLKLPSDRIILYGESIGSGTATQMAYENDIRALILEVPFSSIYELSRDQYPFIPIKFIIKHPFDNFSKIDKVNAPLLLIHGHYDEVIPFKYAQNLFKKAKEPKRFIAFKRGTHNTLYNFDAQSYVIDFIRDIMLNNVSKTQELIVE